MGKKTRHTKAKTPSRLFIRYLVSIATILLLVFTIYPLTRHKVPCANTISCKESFTLNVENNTFGIFNNQKVMPPAIDLSRGAGQLNVLGLETATGEKHIFVDLTKQTLYAYQGKTLVFQTLISSGKWYPTPDGDFTIWAKLRSTRMTGGSGADYYNLPNVPFVMFFSNNQVPGSAGFSLHGAYWHNNFGHAMSHGCVNMRTIDAEKIYNWVDPPTIGNITYSDSKNTGTKITITGQAPI